jgi:hypothetical protein
MGPFRSEEPKKQVNLRIVMLGFDEEVMDKCTIEQKGVWAMYGNKLETI